MAQGSPEAKANYAANVSRLFAFTFLWFFFLWMPVWMIYLQQRGLTLAQIGLLDAIGWVLQSVAELPTGAIADVYSRKASMALGALLLGLAMFAVQARVLSPVFLAGYMLWGVSHTLVSGADAALLYDSLRAAGREAEYTRRAGQHTAVMWASQAAAAVAGGWLAQIDMGLNFTVPGLLAVAAAGVALGFREPPRLGQPATRDGGYTRTLRDGAALAIRDPLVRYPLLLGALIGSYAFFVTFILLQPYARAVGVSLPTLGLLVLGARASAIAGALAAGRMSMRSSPLQTAGGVGVFAVCLLLLVPARTAWSLVPMLAAGLTAGLVRPLLSHEVHRRVPSHRRATVLSLQGALFTLFLVALEPSVLALAGRLGLPAAVAALAGSFGVVAAGCVAGWRRAGRVEAGAGGRGRLQRTWR